MSSEKFFIVYKILKGLGMIRSKYEPLEDIILTQFRVSLEVDDFFEQYNAGRFDSFLKGREERQRFYLSRPWFSLKREVLSLYGKKCMCCGSKKAPSVDHVVSRKNNISLELDIKNCQILCLSCNIKKSSKNMDYRTQSDILLLNEYLSKRTQ